MLIAGLAMSAILPGSPSSAAGEARKTVPASAPRLALVIGNANYAKLGKLGNPGRDARLMALRGPRPRARPCTDEPLSRRVRCRYP